MEFSGLCDSLSEAADADKVAEAQRLRDIYDQKQRLSHLQKSPASARSGGSKGLKSAKSFDVSRGGSLKSPRSALDGRKGRKVIDRGNRPNKLAVDTAEKRRAGSRALSSTPSPSFGTQRARARSNSRDYAEANSLSSPLGLRKAAHLGDDDSKGSVRFSAGSPKKSPRSGKGRTTSQSSGVQKAKKRAMKQHKSFAPGSRHFKD
eukprot:229428_1